MEVKISKLNKCKISQNSFNSGKINNQNSYKNLETIELNKTKKISTSFDSPQSPPIKKRHNINISDPKIYYFKKNPEFLNSISNLFIRNEKSNKDNKDNEQKNDNKFYNEIRIFKINDNYKYLSFLNQNNSTKKHIPYIKLDFDENKEEDITDYIDIRENQYNKDNNIKTKIRNEAIEEVEEAKETSEFQYTLSPFQKSNQKNKDQKHDAINRNKIKIANKNKKIIKIKSKKIVFRNELKNFIIDNNDNSFFLRKSINLRTQIHRKSKQNLKDLKAKTNKTFNNINDKGIVINNNIINMNTANINKITLNKDISNDPCKSQYRNFDNKNIEKINLKKIITPVQKKGKNINYNIKNFTSWKNYFSHIGKLKAKNYQINLEKTINPYNYKTFTNNINASKSLTFCDNNPKINNSSDISLHRIFNNNTFTIINLTNNNLRLSNVCNSSKNNNDKQVNVTQNPDEKYNLVKLKKHFKYKSKFQNKLKKLLSDSDEFNDSKYQDEDSFDIKNKLTKSYVKLKKNKTFDTRLKNLFASKQQSLFLNFPNKLKKLFDIFEYKNKIKTIKNIKKNNKLFKKNLRIKSIYMKNNFYPKSELKIENSAQNIEEYSTANQNNKKINQYKRTETLGKKNQNNRKKQTIKKIYLMDDYSEEKLYKNKLNKNSEKNGINHIKSIYREEII